ncbi:MAG: DUF2254 domain-containing protein [Deltaproteobacteria bacterium]|nr:DUF2254 domain-containing protein [Deltaproteobacteria bacterium]MDQ3301105.1 DUF2254 domain-containing protein [Myxococcota bacterium]
MRGLFARSFAIAFVGFSLFFGIEFFLEWRNADYPGAKEMSWAGTNNGKLVDVLSPMARAYNNLLAMLITMIGLAIPLTANMHTPKLIDMFLRDKINRFVLTFIAFGAAHVLWVDWLIGPEFAPMWAVTLAVYMALLGWAVLIPYFFYVVRFIDPSRLVIRLRDSASEIVEQVANRKADPIDAQQVLGTRVGQIGTIIIKSLDRGDRDVSAEGAWALKVLLDNYDKHKSRMPREWFVVDRADFVGFSDEALEMLSEARTWYEMKCLQQLEHGFLRALHGPTDTVSVFSDAVRVIGCRFDERHDEQSLRLSIRFFNNFLREAIKSRNLRAVYDVFHQYRKLARQIVDRPELLREIGKHFTYYAGMARTYGMVFAPQLALFDLGFVTRRAYERASPAAPDLLKEVLALPHRTGDDVHSMAVKAKLILGGFFVGHKLDAEAEAVRKNLRDVDANELDRAETELLAADRTFFEVTDRQLNLEYVPPERREPLQHFCQSLQTQ